MTSKILQYREIIPDEGKLLKRGDIETTYVCEPYTDEILWEEIDAPKEEVAE